jgi:hypothetical protein
MGTAESRAFPKYAVFELADGNLTSLHGSLSVGELTSLAIDVLSGLEYLHAQCPPVMHGNLKPSHVLWFHRPDGQVSFKLSNASLSQFAITALDSYFPTHNTDQLQYLAPEGDRSCRADMYAFGVMMSEVMPAVERSEARALEVVIAGCCHPDKTQRLTASEALDLLRKDDTDSVQCSSVALRLGVVGCLPWEICVGWSAVPATESLTLRITHGEETCEVGMETGLTQFALQEFNGCPLEPGQLFTFQLMSFGEARSEPAYASTATVEARVSVLRGRYPRVFMLRPVLFHQNTDVIVPGSDVDLPQLADIVKSRDFEESILSIEGHTNGGNLEPEAVELSKVQWALESGVGGVALTVCLTNRNEHTKCSFVCCPLVYPKPG